MPYAATPLNPHFAIPGYATGPASPSASLFILSPGRPRAPLLALALALALAPAHRPRPRSPSPSMDDVASVSGVSLHSLLRRRRARADGEIDAARQDALAAAAQTRPPHANGDDNDDDGDKDNDEEEELERALDGQRVRSVPQAP